MQPMKVSPCFHLASLRTKLHQAVPEVNVTPDLAIDVFQLHGRVANYIINCTILRVLVRLLAA